MVVLSARTFCVTVSAALPAVLPTIALTSGGRSSARDPGPDPNRTVAEKMAHASGVASNAGFIDRSPKKRDSARPPMPPGPSFRKVFRSPCSAPVADIRLVQPQLSRSRQLDGGLITPPHSH